MNKIVLLIVILIIILIISITIFIKFKDKYTINTKKNYKLNEYANEYTNECTTSLEAQDVYKISKNNKLKAASETDFVFQPRVDFLTDRLSYDPIYIHFMTIPGEDPNNIPILYNAGNTEIIRVGRENIECTVSDWDLNVDNIYGIPDGKVVLDPLEQIFMGTTVDEFPIKERIKLIVKSRWQPFIGINLIFMEDDHKFDGHTEEQLLEESTIRISFTPGKGTNSVVGTICKEKKYKNKSTMNFDSFDVGTIIHEFGHALGLIHEHQTPLVGGISNDEWDRPGLYRYYTNLRVFNERTTDKEKLDFLIVNVFNKYKTEEIEGTPFDKYSIMLYSFPSYVFKKYIFRSSAYPNGVRKNKILSFNDVKYINQIYNKLVDGERSLLSDRDLFLIYNTMYPFSTL
jgi:hypothetical protein